MIGDKYKIEVSYPGRGFTQSFPTNNALEWVYEREDGQLFFRKKLSTKLTFKDDPAIPSSDFTELYTVERSANSRCDKIDVIVYKRCSKTGSWEEHYQGYLSMIDGEWNKSHCVVDIPIRPLDQYACLFENWEKEHNLFPIIPERHDGRSTLGAIEYRNCERTILTEIDRGIPAFAGNTGCVDQTEMINGRWTLVQWRINEGVSVYTEWAREVYSGSNPGSGWTDIGGGRWARNVEVYEDINAFLNEGGRYIRAWKIVQYQITNGMKLTDVIEKLLQQAFTCQYTIVSNFFGLNPDGTAPTNRAYDKAFDHVRNTYVFHKNDIRRAKDKDQSATSLIISFKRLLENLKVLFNVYFIIDENEPNKIRLEHVSYWDDRRMLDLTQSRFLKDIEGRWKYTYEKQDLPIKEHFKFMEQGEKYYEFDAIPIEYEYTCSNDAKENEKTYPADYVTTAVDDMVQNPTKYSEDGMVLVEIHPFGYIQSGIARGGNVLRNGNLSWWSLMDFYHRWNRPQQYGFLNTQLVKFDTYKRTRKQEPIQIQLCCSDYTNFNPKDLVKTQLGWGEILTAKYSEPSEVLTVELLHD